MSAYIIISWNVFDTIRTVSMLGKTKWNHLTLMQVKRWIFSGITGQAWTCLPRIRFSVNTTGEPARENRPSRCTEQMFTSGSTPAGEELWVTRLVVKSRWPFSVTGNPDTGTHRQAVFYLFTYFSSSFQSSEKSASSDGFSERTFLTSGKRTFWYNSLITSAHDWWFCSMKFQNL